MPHTQDKATARTQRNLIPLTNSYLGNETSMSSSIDEVKHLNVMVDILDSQTAKVSWIMADTQRHLLTSLEIIYSPLQAR